MIEQKNYKKNDNKGKITEPLINLYKNKEEAVKLKLRLP